MTSHIYSITPSSIAFFARRWIVGFIVSSIKRVSNEFFMLMSAHRVGKGRSEKKTKHAAVVLPEIPEDFESFKHANQL